MMMAITAIKVSVPYPIPSSKKPITDLQEDIVAEIKNSKTALHILAVFIRLVLNSIALPET